MSNLTEVLTPGGTVTNYDFPPTGYPSDFDPVTKLTECPMWPDGPCQGGCGFSAKAKNMTSEERLASTPDPGQLIYDTTLDLLFVGDGSTEGGVQVESTDQADFSRVVFHDPAE